MNGSTPNGFRYRLIGGAAQGQTMAVPFLIERMDFDPHISNPFVRRREWYFLVRLTVGRGVMVAESSLPAMHSRQNIRRDIAAYVGAHAEHYVLCESCATVQPRALLHLSALCHHCHGYRFSVRPEAIRHAAALIATKPPVWLTPDFTF